VGVVCAIRKLGDGNIVGQKLTPKAYAKSLRTSRDIKVPHVAGFASDKIKKLNTLANGRFDSATNFQKSLNSDFWPRIHHMIAQRRLRINKNTTYGCVSREAIFITT
jgi:hypothetical protein